ncbi:MerR family transcriptional regulator [Photobacterium aquae]|uniref:MerR family transcriptional regulator n=1 Tax=Photobacterium aquae TaxID=1195763 RepID=UPI00069CD0C4|nr:MerR family transcriptional regulator [Photobacterium aquae]
MDSEKAFYAIKDVSEITGVNSVTLRAWQRRYGLLNPKRTEKGHRLYSEQDIAQIRHILSWLDKGVAISKVRPLLEQSLSSDFDGGDHDSDNDVEQALQLLANLDAQALDRLLAQQMKEYPLDVFEQRIAAKIEAVIAQEENPLANIQLSLWRGILSERCMAVSSGARRRNKRPCLLVSFDPVPSYRLWIRLLKLVESGYNVTILTSLSGKILALQSLLNQWKTPLLVVDGDNKLTRETLQQLVQWTESGQTELSLSGSICSIHPELMNDPSLEVEQ